MKCSLLLLLLLLLLQVEAERNERKYEKEEGRGTGGEEEKEEKEEKEEREGRVMRFLSGMIFSFPFLIGLFCFLRNFLMAVRYFGLKDSWRRFRGEVLEL